MTENPIHIRLATPADAPACLEIYRPIVEATATSFETEVPTPQEFARRVESTQEQHPWLAATDGGEILGYAYANGHRGRGAYQWCAEVSAYVADTARRRGVGAALYRALLECLRVQGFVNAYAGIRLPNDESVGFHEAMGFTPVGVYRDIGFKLGRWHDVGWWGARLQSPPGTPAPPRPLRECRGEIEDALRRFAGTTG